jgi:hypothetical protein
MAHVRDDNAYIILVGYSARSRGDGRIMLAAALMGTNIAGLKKQLSAFGLFI